MSEAAFKGLTAIITGASSGIGAALSVKLSEMGANLAISARNEEKLQAVGDICRAKGAKVLINPTDVTDEAQCKVLVEETAQTFGGIDLLINNAGVSMGAWFEEVDDLEFFKTLMDVSYFGSVYCTRHALPHLKQRRGRIVALSSLTGLSGVPMRTGYAAAKHAVTGFFDSLRIELLESGVTVTVIYPGFVETEMRDNAFDAQGNPLNEKLSAKAKVMSAEECASITLNAALNRKRQVVMTGKGRVGRWLKLIAPDLVDRIAIKTIRDSL